MSFFSLRKRGLRPKGLLRTTAQPFIPKSMIDTLFDYGEFLKSADKNGSIAVQGPIRQKNIAVIGGGAAGLVAAYELAKIKNIKVTLYEASERLGGRMHSIVIKDKPYNNKIFEMGCMRFPPTSYTMFHYLDKFNLKPIPNFPDPGKPGVPTKLLFENQVIDWPAGSDVPDNKEFQRIGEDFGSMVVYLLGDSTNPNLKKPQKLFDFWAIYQNKPTVANKKKVIEAWQAIIDEYKDVTYYKAVFDLSQNTKIVKRKWTEEDMNRFGALGVGSGGFGPLYVVNFVDIIRLFANGWEEDQELLLSGIISLVDAFKNAMSRKMSGVKIVMRSKITRINKVRNRYQLKFAAKKRADLFDAVIVATSTRAMEYMGLTVDGKTNSKGQLQGSILEQGPKVAIRNLHMMNSSKFFVTTKTKFWYAKNNPTKKDLPFNMQTDELMRGLYCMNYDADINGQPNIKGKGVVLISYVWGDDSSKLLALSTEERYQQFIEAIHKINPTFAKLLDQQKETVGYIDWENSTNYYGAFKLNYPGQEKANHDGFYQYQTAKNGVYIAGESTSYAGGWVEGAMPTGINAACAAAKHVGAKIIPNSPLTKIPVNMFKYDGAPEL